MMNNYNNSFLNFKSKILVVIFFCHKFHKVICFFLIFVIYILSIKCIKNLFLELFYFFLIEFLGFDSNSFTFDSNFTKFTFFYKKLNFSNFRFDSNLIKFESIKFYSNSIKFDSNLSLN